MIQFVRSLFGWNGSAAGRTVVGPAGQAEAKDVPSIQNSQARLNALQRLHHQYKNTRHAPKLKAVYEKTKNLHAYLIAQKRVPELELFHLQNTDHFISTFTAIWAAHQRNQENTPPPVPVSEDAQRAVKTSSTENGSPAPTDSWPRPAARASTLSAEADAAPLLITAISIDTAARLAYQRVNLTGDLISEELGYTSTDEEKETFLAFIAPRLGIYKRDLAYVGNARVYFSTGNPSQPTSVPVLNWKGNLYALHVTDYRLFPVRLNRKSDRDDGR